MKRRNGVIIDAIIVDPPIVFPGETALITIYAHSDDGGPLEYEISASEGFIEPTDQANVFLWRLPESDGTDHLDLAGSPVLGEPYFMSTDKKEVVIH